MPVSESKDNLQFFQVVQGFCSIPLETSQTIQEQLHPGAVSDGRVHLATVQFQASAKGRLPQKASGLSKSMRYSIFA